MAEKTRQGYKFVNISYDPKRLGSEMTLVPFMVKRFSTGEVLPEAEEIKQDMLAKSTPQIKLVNNELKQKNINVRKIIAPVVNMSEDLKAALLSRGKTNPKKSEAQAILSQVRKQLSDEIDRKSTRLNSSHIPLSRMPSSA